MSKAKSDKSNAKEKKPVSQATLVRRARSKSRGLEKLVAEGDIEAVRSYWQENAPIDFTAEALKTAYTKRWKMPEMFSLLVKLGATFSTANSIGLRRTDKGPHALCLLREPSLARRGVRENQAEEKDRLAALELICDQGAADLGELLYRAILWDDQPAVEIMLSRGIDLSEDRAAMVRGDLGFINEAKGLTRQMRFEFRYAFEEASTDEVARMIENFTKCASVDMVAFYKLDMFDFLNTLRERYVSKQLMRIMLEKTNMRTLVRRRDIAEAVVARNDAEDLQYLLDGGWLKRRTEIEMLVSLLRDATPERPELLAIALRYETEHASKPVDEFSFDADPLSAKFMRLQWDYKLTEDRTGIRLNRYKGMNTDIVIPPRIGKRPVVQIDSGLLRPKRNATAEEVQARYRISTIEIPGSVEQVPSELLYCCCDSVRKVVLNEGTRVLEDSAMYSTAISDIWIPDSVEEIGRDCFVHSQNLKNIRLPEGIVRIGAKAFSGCMHLKNLPDIPEGCSVGEGAFSYGGLVDVTVPNQVQYGQDVFKNCRQLTRAAFAPGTAVVPTGMFRDCAALSEICLPPSLERIEDFALYNCRKLSEVELPASLAAIGDAAFAGCESLKAVRLSETLRHIGKQVFERCTSLQEAYVPDGVHLGQGMFQKCVKLESVRLPDNLPEIPQGAFSGCKSLRSVALPSGTERIGTRAFAGSGLESVDLPEAVRAIEPQAFFESRLAQLEIPTTVAVIGKGAFRGCKELERVTFQGCGTAKIPESCFSDCTKLQEVAIPNGLIAIGDGAFRHTAIRRIIIPSTVQYIGPDAFAECQDLEEVIFDASTSPGKPAALEIGDKAFRDCPNLRSITIPERTSGIGTASFRACPLETIAIPHSVQEMGAELLKTADR